MIKIARFIFIFGFLSLVFYLWSTVPVSAQTQSPSPTSTQYLTQRNSSAVPPPTNTSPGVPNNLHNWTQNVMIEVMLALTCQLVGIDPMQPNGQCLGVDQRTGKIGFLPAVNLEKGQLGGAIGGVSNMITMLYNPPIHTGDYIQSLAQNFGIVKNANAQATGAGFEGLKPLLSLWAGFRNIVYLLFVIVFVAIGLAIMFRVKIDPRTVMSIQNQIPKIIIGILLVTFSFAIAGFLVDLMWIIIYLVFGLISNISPDVVRDLNPASLQGKSPFGALGAGSIWDIIFNSSKGVGNFLGSLLGGGGGIAGGVTGAAIGALLGSIVPGILTLIGGVVGGVIGLVGVGKTVGFIGGLIAFLIILIAVLIALFRLWFALLMAYIHILIDVVLAPFWIVGSLVPGSTFSAVGWLRDLIANLAAFPTVIFLFLLGKIFMDAFENATNPFLPPLIGNPGDIKSIGAFIGLGIILMTPNVVNMVKTALKAPKLDTGGIGTSLRGGAGMYTGGFKGTVGMVAATKYNPLTGAKFIGDEAKKGRFGRMFLRAFR